MRTFISIFLSCSYSTVAGIYLGSAVVPNVSRGAAFLLGGSYAVSCASLGFDAGFVIAAAKDVHRG